MPTFPQFVLESLAAFLILLGHYRLTHSASRSFRGKRWQLRLIPIFAYLLPLVPALFSDPEIAAALPQNVQVMSIGRLLDFHLPAFSINISSLILAVYFVGVVVSSFRLADRYWLVSQFLQEKGNHPTGPTAWQAMPTALMSYLILNWQYLDEHEKEKWAMRWLPLHPVFGWEALLVELLVVVNWWNPLAYRYRSCWADLYAAWQVERKSGLGFLTINSLGFTTLASGIALLFALLPSNLSPTHRVGELADRFFKKTIYENTTERPHEYTLAWGDVKLPLKKYANPNGYSAELEVELTDFQDIIKEELRIYRDGEPMKPGTLSFTYRSYQTGAHAYINGIDPKKVKLLQRQTGVVFNDSLGLGDELVLFGDAEDIYLSRIEIRIKDPNAGYEPAFLVPQISHLEANMPYQIVLRRNKRALVKIDPNHPNVERILQLYSDERQYEIVEIPGFRTNRHYLTEAESLASKVEAVSSLTLFEKDAYYLPEYLGYQNKDVRMIWGQMEAAPSNDNYELDSFLLSIDREPQLLVGEDTLTIISFEVTIVGKNRPAKGFRAYRTGDLAIKDALLSVTNETSVFFEKIVVAVGEERSRQLFPASFAFNVGKPGKHHTDTNNQRLHLPNKATEKIVRESPDPSSPNQETTSTGSKSKTKEN